MLKISLSSKKWGGNQNLSKPRQTKYHEKDHVVVQYENKFFPGIVTEVQIEEESGKCMYKVNALERFGKK